MGAETWDAAPSLSHGDEWRQDSTSAGAEGFEPDGFEVDADEQPFTGEFAQQNVSKHAASDGGCRICGGEGHFARDCPEKKDNSGECYNCGEMGHNKADCPNPAVEREFTGVCHVCNLSGHRARDCPTRPGGRCKLCLKDDHATTECSNNRMDSMYVNYRINDMSVEKAWQEVIYWDMEKDVDEIKIAILTYLKAFPEMTVVELENALRKVGMATHLIAKTQEISDTHTIINFQGEPDQKYALTFQFSARPRRVKHAGDWPSSPEENLERLAEAGFIVDRGVEKCRNCEELGHIARDCPEEKVEKSKIVIACTNCNEEGHRPRDCPEPRKFGGRECRHCGETGHIAKDCPTKEPEICRNCGEEGHRAKDCEKERVMRCRNCDGEGHSSRECPEPKNMAKVQCRNCDEMGHVSRECPKPTDWSRVECTNCHEKGHSYKRCTKPAGTAGDGDDAAGDGGDGGWGAPSVGSGNANADGGW